MMANINEKNMRFAIAAPIVSPGRVTCNNEHHYGVLAKFARFWGLLSQVNLEKLNLVGLAVGGKV